MKVRATQVGFYGGVRRRVDDVFNVPDGATAKWFEPVEAPAAPAPKQVKPKVAKPDPVVDEGAGDLV